MPAPVVDQRRQPGLHEVLAEQPVHLAPTDSVNTSPASAYISIGEPVQSSVSACTEMRRRPPAAYRALSRRRSAVSQRTTRLSSACSPASRSPPLVPVIETGSSASTVRSMIFPYGSAVSAPSTPNTRRPGKSTDTVPGAVSSPSTRTNSGPARLWMNPAHSVCPAMESSYPRRRRPLGVGHPPCGKNWS
ncbi:MAG TPA: hypothetical protein VGH27_24930 [Streptosporangiaceae bacterium]